MLIITLVLATVFSTFNSPTTTHNFTIEVTNIKTVKGHVYFALYNNPKNFPKGERFYKRVKVKVGKSSVRYTFKGLANGDYAVAVYHDKNDDNKCNLNLIGVPTEGYGFSRNFRPILSVPKFNDCKINLNTDKTTSIKLIH